MLPDCILALGINTTRSFGIACCTVLVAYVKLNLRDVDGRKVSGQKPNLALIPGDSAKGAEVVHCGAAGIRRGCVRTSK